MRLNGSPSCPSMDLCSPSPATDARGSRQDSTHRLIAEPLRKLGSPVPDNAGRHTFISMQCCPSRKTSTRRRSKPTTPQPWSKKGCLDIVTREESDQVWAIIMTRSRSAGDSRSVEGSLFGSRYQIRSRRLLRHPRIRPAPIDSRNNLRPTLSIEAWRSKTTCSAGALPILLYPLVRPD